MVVYRDKEFQIQVQLQVQVVRLWRATAATICRLPSAVCCLFLWRSTASQLESNLVLH